MVGPALEGQFLGRFWSGSAEVIPIPDRLHAGAILGSLAVAAAAVSAAAAAVAGGSVRS